MTAAAAMGLALSAGLVAARTEPTAGPSPNSGPAWPPEQEPEVPLGLIPVFWPDDNPYSPEKAELGRLLYFDSRLSSDNSISCASCHEPSKAFTDSSPVSTGISAQKGGRSAPTVINRAFTTLQFWDGRAASLEEQAIGPLANPLEMTLEDDSSKAHEAVVARLVEIPGYRPRFASAFGDEQITLDRVAKAIATFERTVYSGNSPYDRFKSGDESALTESQRRGMDVFFNKAACDACHLGFNFSDESFVNIGIGYDPDTGVFTDPGRYAVTKSERDLGAFKTPTLREVEHSSPYMHDGSFATLEEVVEHYDKGGIPNPHIDQRMKPLNMSATEKADLVAFLKALGGEGWQHVQAPSEFPR
ncbi:Cytochrome c551 peroxidase precursor [Tautonia plasticadhaerens]|uniref:Methylamine utilization protein MauG n=2 Tax=Tautonia plasticadhaerens TaxID=2527974 RepID=A0A518H6X4_9BACT|nr:Cytochrome c551 peroxidase precursor [Tautonia plasticadhaerens]